MRAESGAGFIFILAFSQSADALVASPAVRADVAAFNAEIAAHENDYLPPSSLVASVPRDLETFRIKFEAMLQEDNQTGMCEPSWKKVKVAIGIFTTLTRRSKEIRQILRDTWMRHPSICSYQNITEMCRIRYVFVAGSHNEKWVEKYKQVTDSGMVFLKPEPDVALLNMKESMNGGKTFYWLQYASRRFYGVDYVGKVDDDAFLHTWNVLEALPATEALNGCEAYFGKPWTCLNPDCPPRYCGPPINGDFMKYNESSDWPVCWSYMQGGFYVMSRTLAEAITVPKQYYDQNKIGSEDMITGRAVYHYAHETQKCVRTFKSQDVRDDNLFFHARAENEHPGGVSLAWDSFYGANPYEFYGPNP